MSTGLVLFGHGARDPRWREPFDRLKRLVSARHPGPVSLAFLELMEPDLLAAVKGLAERGATRIVVVPMFLGTGGHIQRDLPLLINAAAAAVNVPVSTVMPAGEDTAVLDALAEYCLISVTRSMS